MGLGLDTTLLYMHREHITTYLKRERHDVNIPMAPWGQDMGRRRGRRQAQV